MPMPMSSPVTATYLPPLETPKVVNILDLCRQLIAEWQYHDHKAMMHLVKHEKFPVQAQEASTNAAADVGVGSGGDSSATDLAQRKIEENVSMLRFGVPMTNGEKSVLRSFMKEKVSVTRIHMRDDALTLLKILKIDDDGRLPLITAKDFRNMGHDKLSDKELHKIYWRVRMRFSCATLNQIVGEMAEQLKKQGYQGFLLPDGKMVTFDSMNFVLLEFVPKSITLLQFEMGGPSLSFSHSATEVIECPRRVNKFDGLFCQHVALCFKLPSETGPETLENPAKILVVDATSTQFGIFGAKGDMVYWSYMKEYIEKFQSEEVAEKLNVYGFEPWNYKDCSYSKTGPPMTEMALQNFGKNICGYCGEVDGRKQVKKGVVGIIVLKKCGRCMKLLYCDEICQKLGWAKHNSECKKSDD